MKKASITKRKIQVANEILEAVENYSITKGINPRYVVEEIVRFRYEYASQCFKSVYQISLGKYVNRRLLTEIYRKQADKYEEYKWNEKVEGIKNFKRRMKSEFGDSIKNLQDKITPVQGDDLIVDGEVQRFCAKKVNKLEKEYKELLVDENRVLLIENGKVNINEWKTKMIKHNGICYVIHGEIFESSGVSDTFFSKAFGEMAYILAKKEYSVANILQVLAAFHEESKKKISLLFGLWVEVWDAEGVWEMRNLIDRLALSSSGDSITEIKLSERWLKWEENNLYLYLE